MTTPSDPDSARRAAAARIPAALERALDHYDAISDTEVPADTKEKSSHQAACKAALSHVEAALKLLDQAAPQAATGDAQTADQRAELGDLVREARTAVARLRRDP
jgi:hypothetical protein